MSLTTYTGLTRYKDLLDNEDIKRLMQIFDLEPIPMEYLNRLLPGRPYDIDLVYDRLKKLEVISCDKDTFKDMVSTLEGFRISGNNIFKKGRREAEFYEDIPDPEVV